MRLNAERQLSAMEGFEFEDGYCGSGSWKPILDQNAVQSLRMLQRSETHRCSYTIGSNTYEATMQFNGEIRQQDRTSRMIFSFTDIIAYVSTFTPLKPGDVLVCGTPTGAGARFDPPKWLKPGDIVEISADGLATLSNGVRDEEV